MTEIKLSTDEHDIADLIRYLDGDHHMSVYDRLQVIKAIKAQLPKPAPAEPTGDVVVFVLGRPWWPRAGGVHWATVEHSNNPPTWGELTDEVDHDDIVIYRRDQHDLLLQQVRDLLFRSPSGLLTPNEMGDAYKALRKGLGGILEDNPQSDATGALPTSPSPEVGVATSPPVASPGPAPDGFCTCYPEGPAKDCGIGEHRDQARLAYMGEPQGFGSIVRAGMDEYSDRILWCRTRKGGWFSEEGTAVGDYSFLDKPEVLRVGVDGKVSFVNGYAKGTDNTRARHIGILTALKPDLITAPEKTAIDKALALIKADIENTVTGRGYPS